MRPIKKGFWGMALYASTILLAAVLLVIFLPAAGGKPEGKAETAVLPILMYHDVRLCSCKIDDYTLSTEQLASDLASLKAEGWNPVRLKDVTSFVLGQGTLPEKPILLVFDDGYKSVSCQVLPLLAQYDAPAVVSVIGARAEGLADGCASSGRYLNWVELKQLQKSGLIELQSHSANLHVYRARKGVSKLPGESDKAYQTMFTNDIKAMDSMCRRAHVHMTRAFAYPYGYVEAQADELLTENRYLVTMTSEEHSNLLTKGDPSCLYQLGRFNRSGYLSTRQVLEWLDCACRNCPNIP